MSYLIKESVKRIADLLEPKILFEIIRGVLLSPNWQVFVALHHYAGGQFQRVTEVCCGISQACIDLDKDVLIEKRYQITCKPTELG